MSVHPTRELAGLAIILAACGVVAAADATRPPAQQVTVPPLELTPEQLEAARARLEATTVRSVAVEPRAAWLVDDFEDGLDPGWTDVPGGGTWSIDTIGAAGTGHSLEIVGGGSLYSGLRYDMAEWQPTGVTVHVRSSSTTTHDGYVVLGDAATESNNGVIFFYAQGNGNLSVVTNGGINYSCGAYAADTWYDVHFVIDWSCEVFDVYVDGVLKQYNLPFRNPAAGISELHVFNADVAASAWWDQIAMYTPGVSFEIFSDAFERGSSCHWSATVN